MTERSYAELVLHVLAHLPLPEPGSVHEPDYVAWCAERAGASAARELGEDIQVLSQLLAPLELRVGCQGLAALFEDSGEAERFALVELADFPGQGVRSYDHAVWRQLLARRPAVEVLRLACEVERMHLEQISPPSPDPALARYLAELTCVAPALERLRVRELRPLWRRGRLMREQVWVGSATRGEGPGLAHVAWQACHEATLSEVSRRWRSQAAYDVGLELATIVVLKERAYRAGRAEEHRRWFTTLGGELPGGIDELRHAVPEDLRCVVEQLVR